MTYHETLFFIGKCLTVNDDTKNKDAIKNKLVANTIDWELVVKVSTAHYVFPALYINLNRANLTQYLPKELVSYMKHVTELNRERNQEIIKQAKELNDYLTKHDIHPIFLKGTGNLLEGLYDDIGERMIGDIDFLFSKKDYNNAIKIITDFGYTFVKKTDYDIPEFKHYKKLKKANRIAAIEIHKELTTKKYATEFNYTYIKDSTQKIDGISVMSFENQLCLSVIAQQINDQGRFYHAIALRNAYDVYLLSKKTTITSAFQGLRKLYIPLINFIALCYEVFHKPKSLLYQETTISKKYVKTFYKLLNNPKQRAAYNKKIKLYIKLKSRIKVILVSIYDNEYRYWLYRTLTDKNWYKKKLKKLKFIK